MALMSNRQSEAQRVIGKWGEAAVGGFQAVPDVLLKNQDKLGLTPTELVVLLNITMHWWYLDQRPFPRSTTIAKRMGLEPRTIQRAIARLQDLKLLAKVKEPEADTGEREVCDLSGLVVALSNIAKDDPDYNYRRAQREVKNDETA
jgi:hypothetical protein